LRPEKGRVLVTGATGGVGSLALSFLNRKGYESEAWTRRKDEHKAWLEACGADYITDISEKDFSTKALESVEFAGAIDNVGGEGLHYILARLDLWSSVASIGLAGSEKLETTVFPMILRGANILGISSNNCPFSLRKEIWEKIAGELKPKNLLHMMSEEVALEDVPDRAQDIVKGNHLGRTVVKYVD
jgi:putative YhdH/YhfP family quinone oxidoreductase